MTLLRIGDVKRDTRARATLSLSFDIKLLLLLPSCSGGLLETSGIEYRGGKKKNRVESVRRTRNETMF